MAAAPSAPISNKIKQLAEKIRKQNKIIGGI